MNQLLCFSILNLALITLTYGQRGFIFGDEKIPFYRENDASIVILNKFNNKFDNNNLQAQTIENSFDLENLNKSDDAKSDSSMYTLLYADKRSFLVGARNRLFNFSMQDLYDKEFVSRVSELE